MASKGTKRYAKIVVIIMKCGTFFTQTLLEKRIKDLTPQGHDDSISAFLNRHKTQILNTETGKNNRNKLFPQFGTTSINNLDLYLLCYLLEEICQLETNVKIDIQKLHGMRNDLCHLKDPVLTNSGYNNYLSNIKVIFKRTYNSVIKDQLFEDELTEMVESFDENDISLEDMVKLNHEMSEMLSSVYAIQQETHGNTVTIIHNLTGMDGRIEGLSRQLSKIEGQLQHGTRVDSVNHLIIEFENCPDDKDKQLSILMTDMFMEQISGTPVNSDSKATVQTDTLKLLERVVSKIIELWTNNGWQLQQVENRCICLTFKCGTLSSFVKLMTEYLDGSIIDYFDDLLTTVRRIEGYKEVTFVTVLYEDQIVNSIAGVVNTLDTIAQQKGDGNVRLSDMQNMLAEAWHLEGDIDTLGRTKQLNEVVPNVLELEEGSSSPSKSDYSVNVKHQPDNKTKDTLPNEKTFEPHRKRHTDEMSHEKQDENDTSSETDPSNKDDTDNDNDDDDPPDTGGGVILPKSTSMGRRTIMEEELTIHISMVEGKELGWGLITKWYSEFSENGQKISQKWLVVERIHLHGLAHRSRIKVGDRLIQIQGIPVEQVDKDAVGDIIASAGKDVTVVVRRMDEFPFGRQNIVMADEQIRLSKIRRLEEEHKIHISMVEGEDLGWHLTNERYFEKLETNEQGVFVERIRDKGLANRSGIKAGDRLIQIQDISIEHVDLNAVEDIIASAGKDLTVVVMRQVPYPYSHRDIAIKELLAKRKNTEKEYKIRISKVEGEDMGWHLTTERYCEELEENEKGVFVDRISVNGLANRCGIKAGDKLIKINDITIEQADILTIEDIIASAGKDLTVRVVRMIPLEIRHKEKTTKRTSIKEANPSQLRSGGAAARYPLSASNKVEVEHVMVPIKKKTINVKNEESDEEEENVLSIEVSAETFIRRFERLAKIQNFPDDIDPNPFIRHGRSFTDLTDEEIFQFMREPRRKHFAKKDVPNITSASNGIDGYRLHEAVFNKDVELCNTLLQSDAGLVNQTNIKQETALHVAAMVSSVECMHVLTQAGADVNACNKWGQTPLHYAAEYKTLPALNVLLSNPSVDVNKKDINGFTSLLSFIDSCENYCQDWINVVQLFVNAGADINSQTVYGQSILHLVSNKSSEIDFLSHLIKTYKNINFELCTVMDENFLHILVMNASGREISKQLDKIDADNEGVVKRLLNTVDKFGEAPWYIMYKRGETPLSLFESFVSKYGISVEKTDNHGNTGLHQLAITILCQFSLECMEKFTTIIDINSRNVFGQTPVSMIGDDDVLKLFTKFTVDVNVSDRWGRTPLMHIIGQKPPTDPVMIDILVKQGGADVNAKDADGSTALHYAAYCGTSEQISRLISYGADVEAKDNQGDRPIDTARRHQNSQCYEFLATACKPDAEPSSKNILGNLLSRTTHEIAFSSLNDSDQSVRELLNIYVNNELFTDDLLNERYVDMSKGDLKEEIEVINAVRQHVTEMCEIIAGYDDLFTMKIYPTGSSVEGTKVGSPDEFDFVLLLENISQHFEESDGQEKGYANLKIKEQSKHIQKLLPFIDEERYFIAHPFLNYLHRYFKRSIMERRLWQDGRLYYRSEDELFHRHGKPVNTFSMYWMGSKYKKLKISVDLVPAVYKPGWWPTYIKLDKIRLASEKVRAAGCLVLLQMHTENFNVIKMRNSTRSTVNSYFIDSNKRMLRISVAPAEIALITSLPENFRRGYALAKIMKGDDICPTLEMDRYPGFEIPEFKRLKVKPSSVLKSYLLKNCTFYIAAEILGSIEINITPKNFAIKIFEYLLEHLHERRRDKMVLKPYFLPYANIFETTFDEKRLPSNIFTQMFNRQAIVRTILGILGAPSFEKLSCESLHPLTSV